jgi:hypothetical protein
MEALVFPRFLVRGSIELHRCPHNANFAEADTTCHLCDFGPECQWLVHNDEFAALASKSLEELVDALEFALGYVDVQISHWGHNRRHCHCDACTWLRRAKHLHSRLMEL